MARSEVLSRSVSKSPEQYLPCSLNLDQVANMYSIIRYKQAHPDSDLPNASHFLQLLIKTEKAVKVFVATEIHYMTNM